jgi:hypothetical protein
MEVITAPGDIDLYSEPSCFLAGGITNCPWWQDDIIEALAEEEGTLFNPRRRDFDVTDPDASRKQITWEFFALEAANVFSMWFSNAESDQPICLYELDAT